MKQITDWNKLEFRHWDDIRYQGESCSSFFGKTFFYFDKKSGSLYTENLNIIERLLRFIFGYKKEFNRESFWEFLKSKNITVGDCPNKGAFRKLVGERLSGLNKNRETYFEKVIHSDAVSEDDMIRFFEDGVDVNAENLSGYFDTNAPAFWEACYRRQYKVARYLLDHGADINKGYIGGYVAQTPFHAVLANDNQDLALEMVSRGLDLEAKSHKNQTPLHLATIYGSKAVVEAILTKNPDLNVLDEFGRTALYYASEQGDLEIVKLLIEKGANAAEGKFGSFPLLAAIYKENQEVISFLFSQGLTAAPIEVKESAGEKYVYSPLMEALHFDTKPNRELIDFLLANGADLNEGTGVNGRARLPLNAAIDTNDAETVRYFIEKGAKVNALNVYGRSALSQAVNMNSYSGSLSTIKVLIEAGGDPNITPQFGNSPLHEAVEKKSAELVTLLLTAPNIQVDIPRNFGRPEEVGWTPLQFARKFGCKEIEQLLVQHGARDI